MQYHALPADDDLDNIKNQPVPAEGGKTPALAEPAVREYILDTFSRKFNVDKQNLATDENLLEMGLDSSLIIKVAEEIEADLDVKLYPTVFFEHRTLNEIISYFAQQFPDKFIQSRRHQTVQNTAPSLPFPDDPAADQPIMQRSDNIHCFSLEWEAAGKVDTASPGLAVADTYMVFVNDSSEIKKHIIRKKGATIQLLQPGNPEQTRSRPSAPAAHIYIYINEKKVQLEQSSDCIDVTFKVLKEVKDFLLGITAAGLQYPCKISFIVESAVVLSSPFLFSLRSFSKSLAVELPHFSAHVLGIKTFSDSAVDWMLGFAGVATNDIVAACTDEDIYFLRPAEIALVSGKEKENNTHEVPTYLITGGSGKLGQMIGSHLCQAADCNVVLLGRSNEPSEINQLRAGLVTRSRIAYKKCDVTALKTLQTIIREVNTEYGPIHGIIHAAGVLDDGLFLNKTPDSILKVVQPKIAGIVHLDVATADEPLEFFIAFSSLSAFTGNRAQTDYAYANGFMDGFILHRNLLVEAGRRKGKSISVNWPLWENGGMTPRKEVVDLMESIAGIVPLPGATGKKIFDKILHGNHRQLCVVQGNKEKFMRFLQSKLGRKTEADQSFNSREHAIDPGSGPLAVPVSNAEKMPTRKQYMQPENLDTATPHIPALSERTISDKNKPDDVAIIGMHGRFPRSADLATFWKNLESETDMITHTPEERYAWWKVVAQLLGFDEKEYIFWGGFLDGIDEFDAAFFNISKAEAEVIDPQQRIFFESCWKCLEDAGYDPKSFSGSRTGVFAGISTRDYNELLLLFRTQIEPQHSTGLASNMLANRTSYLLNLNGPSEIVDTACSSSLVALHRAVQSIQTGESDCAIVGGVNLMVSPLAFMAFSRTGILSKDGRCKSFAKDANGYVRGEGVGTLLLKPLSKAIQEGDNIYAVIKGSHVNHGGKAKGLTAPNPVMQADVVARTILAAGCSPDAIGYIEAHGTGTALGDPVEIEGLKKAFKTLQQKKNIPLGKQFCGVGTVKSNIGHLEAAAGVAGVIKVLLAMKHKKIPASLHIDEVNPHIHLENSPFYLVRKTKDWPAGPLPKLGGISSFGFGGANAHVLLEEYVRKEADQPADTQSAPYLLPFSAPGPEQLNMYLNAFARFLEQSSAPASLQHIAYTLQIGRAAYPFRKALIANSLQDVIRQIDEMPEAASRNNVLPEGFINLLENNAGKLFIKNLFDEGKLNHIAQLWEQGMNIEWTGLYKTPLLRVPLPSFPFKKTKFWVQMPDIADIYFFKSQDARGMAGPATEQVQPQAVPPADEAVSVEDFLVHELAALLKKNSDEIERDMSFLDYGLDSILGMTLVKKIEQQYKIPIYVNEILQNDTIRKLAHYLTGEIEMGERLSSGNNIPTKATEDAPARPPAEEQMKKNEKPIIFLLSTPRAGSTLLRTMLMGHPALFAPPELHLLNFTTMKERADRLSGTGLDEGLVETIRQIKGIGTLEARELIGELAARETADLDVYALLQDLLPGQVLVDKSPSYSSDLEIMKKSYAHFTDARYVFLVRHPLAVMESIVRNRFHKFIRSGNDNNPEPYKQAEKVWHDFNRNILAFSRLLPPERYKFVFYEDLVTNPVETSRKICKFLKLPFHEEMLSPYKSERMIHGLHEHSLSIGDPNFLQHTGIEDHLAFEWIDKLPACPLPDRQTLDLASEFGYDAGQDLPLSSQQSAYLNRSKYGTWNLVHEFAFESRTLVSTDDFKKGMKKFLGLYPTLSRLLDKTTQTWKAAPDQASLYAFDIVVDLPADESGEEMLQRMINQYKYVIDAEHGPLLYVAVVKDKVNQYKGALIYSHLAGDGISSAYLIENMFLLLTAASLRYPVVQQSYIHYITHTKTPETKAIPAAEKESGGALPGFSLHCDMDGQENDDASEQELTCFINLSKDVPDDGSTLFFHAGESLVKALRMLTSSQAIVLELRHHNRFYKKIIPYAYTGTVGLLATDTLLLIREPDGKDDAFQEAYYTAEKSPDSMPADVPHLIRFNYQTQLGSFARSKDLHFGRNYQVFDPREIRQHALECIVREHEKKLELLIRFSKNQFFSSTMEALLEKWKSDMINSLNPVSRLPVPLSDAHEQTTAIERLL
ncbi:MAG: SDR family NAD(P)-dependent oxidoreductase [Williamsia sp.]|nr:SDR family NAD(P)-dependent oxidoreductase [Williamsia sp.]